MGRPIFKPSDEWKKDQLRKVKEEIYRMGIQDMPRRTFYQEHYNRTKTNSPTSLMGLFQCTWEELMGKIGLHYSKEESWTHYSSLANKGKRHAVRWADMSSNDIMDIVVNEMRDKDIWNVTDYDPKRDKDKTPSVPVILQKIGGWKLVKSEYARRYGGRMSTK